MKKYLIGMDLGTTNIKATLFDENGVVVSSVSSAGYPLIFPGPDMVEQDPEQWWDSAKNIFLQITAEAGAGIVKNICGISISSHVFSLLPVDKNGNVLHNALIWMDKRAAGEMDYILDVIGISEYVKTVGAQPSVAFMPGKILWFKKNKPELFENTYRILQANSFINYKLTGEMTVDMDTACLSQCLDLNTLKWSEHISKAIGVELHTILPQPVNNDVVIGHVTDKASLQTGLKQGIPVVAGTCDAIASMYATGISEIGEAGESSGTTSLIFAGHDKTTELDIPVTAKPCAIEGIPYMFNAPISASGASINWYLNNLGKAEYDYAAEYKINVYQHLNELADQVTAGSNGLLYFPYMIGERAPLWNSYSKGMFIGLSLDTERKEIVRSIFEGTAFAVRHVIETIKESGAVVNSLRIAGGGAKSHTWCRIKASMLGVPVYTLADNTGDVTLGNALIAGYAVGVFHNFTESLKRLITVKEVIEPVREWADIYDELYPYYISMYRHLDDDLKQLNRTMTSINSRGLYGRV